MLPRPERSSVVSIKSSDLGYKKKLKCSLQEHDNVAS